MVPPVLNRTTCSVQGDRMMNFLSGLGKASASHLFARRICRDGTLLQDADTLTCSANALGGDANG